jgi:hypothetical protein
MLGAMGSRLHVEGKKKSDKHIKKMCVANHKQKQKYMVESLIHILTLSRKEFDSLYFI